MLEPSTALAFSVFENKGVFALLLGSGVSRAAQVPTGWEITLDLIRRVASLEGVKNASDWAKWYRNKFGNEPNYSELLDALASTPDERRSILHSYIEPTPEDIETGRKVPTAAHRAIARIVRDGFIRIIITTNFDRLIENSLRDEGVEPTVVKSDDDLKGAVPFVHSCCFVLKLHGDYLDTRIKNTETELSKYSRKLNGLLDRIFDEHGLIVCGWSGDWDHALRAALTRAPNRRYPMFWAARSQLSKFADELVRHRGGKVITITDADAFFTGLQRQVEIQAEIQRPNPESTDLLLAGAKKYLAKPEYRIQLHELIGDEVRRLIRQMGEPGLEVQGSLSDEEFRKRVARYEAIAEPLVRLFGLLGRWGDDGEFPIATEILQEFGREEPVGGLIAWIELRRYPAVLLLYAYGLGLLKACRYDLLFRWFSTKLQTSRAETEPVIGDLFLLSWRGGEKELWQRLEGLEGYKTPLSDHLHDRFLGWSEDYLFSNNEYTKLFETFETLGSLAFLTLKESKENLDSAIQSQPQWEAFVWSPVGRAAWDTDNRNGILADFREQEYRKSLLQAGFANGDSAFLDLALENISRLMSRIARR